MEEFACFRIVWRMCAGWARGLAAYGNRRKSPTLSHVNTYTRSPRCVRATRLARRPGLRVSRDKYFNRDSGSRYFFLKGIRFATQQVE